MSEINKRGRPRKTGAPKWNRDAVAQQLNALLSSSIFEGHAGNLARELGVSTTTLHYWRHKDSEKVLVPTKRHALRIGVVSARAAQKNPLEECRKWLELTGHLSTTKEEEIEVFVRQHATLGGKAEHAFKELEKSVSDAGLKDERLAQLAVSAFFSQLEVKDRIKRWFASVNGVGDVAVFWSWREGQLLKAFKDDDNSNDELGQATRGFLAWLRNPLGDDEIHRQNVLDSRIVVRIFVVDPDESSLNRIKILKNQVLSGNSWAWLQFEVRKQLDANPNTPEHFADAWVFSGTTKSNRFMVLASRPENLMESILNIHHPEFHDNPWQWSHQLVSMPEHVMERFLKAQKVTYDSWGRLEPAKEMWEAIS